MRLYAPLHESDYLRHPDAAFGEAMARILNSPTSASTFVHGNIADEAAMKAAPDLQEMEICERAASGAWVAGLWSSLRRTVADWAARHDNAERGFAGAVSFSDPALWQRDLARAELARYMFTDC